MRRDGKYTTETVSQSVNAYFITCNRGKKGAAKNSENIETNRGKMTMIPNRETSKLNIDLHKQTYHRIR